MKINKFVLLIISILLVLSACTKPNPDVATDQNKNNDKIDENTYVADSNNSASSLSYVEQLANDKATEIGMFEANEEDAIRLAYEYLVENIYFADPVGLDVWRYFSDEPETAIPYIENRSLSPFMFNIGSCEDFAATLTMLLEAKGLEAEYIAGFTLSKDQVYIDHAWTMVKLEDKWYHLDPQLEQNVVRDNKLRYRFFMKTDEEMLPDHKWSQNLVDYWPDMPDYEKNAILEYYNYNSAYTTYPTPEAKDVILPQTPILSEVYSEIDKIKQTKILEPIDLLNVEPPILVSRYHITPPLTNSTETGANAIVPYGKSTLSSGQVTLYNKLVIPLKLNDSGSFTPSGNLSEADVYYTIRQVLNDNPEFYWAKLEYDSNNQTIDISYKNSYSKDVVRVELEKLKEISEDLIAEYRNSSDFEKALYIHDYLADNVYYDYGYKGQDSDNPFGAIVDDVAYCDGYTRGFQYLANMLELENIYLAGRNDKTTTHAWNAVKMDNEWYYVDVTWDRSSHTYSGPLHTYLGVTSDECFQKRTWDDSQYYSLPVATSNENNYFIKTNYQITDSDNNSPTELRQRIVEIANKQLSQKTNIKDYFSYAFVEFRISTSEEDYKKIKSVITKDLFYILEDMDTIAANEDLGFTVSFDSEVSCYYNDDLQIVSFYPKVKNNN